MHHAIIGMGPAGVTAAETLRGLDPDARISLIGDEPEPPYSRMAIPYYLNGKIEEQGTYLRSDKDHFDGERIELVQARVEKIDTAASTLSLNSGKTLEFDRLLIATGASPISPPIPGIDLPNVHSCWTLDDARKIAALAKPKARVVLMGAGFIGCIILEALALRGVRLVVVELENRMVPRMMNDKAGALIKQWCQGKGVDVHTSTKVTGIEPDGDGMRVSLDNKKQLQADLVITATGVRPNLQCVENTGVKVEQGILVDRRLQSSVAGIFAAGDVAQGRDFSTEQAVVQAIQPTAVEHGRLAALNMAGRDVEHQGCIAMNVLDTLGLISSSFGQWMGVDGGESIELIAPEDYRYLNLQLAEDRLVGGTSLGLTQHVGVLRGLIQSKVRLGAWVERIRKDPLRVVDAYVAHLKPV